MKRLIELARYLMVVAVVALAAAAVGVLAYGAAKTFELLIAIVQPDPRGAPVIARAVEVADIFLVVASLLIVSVSLYELFIGELKVPGWLVVRSLGELKDKLAHVVVLVSAVSFLKYLLNEKNRPHDIMRVGLAVAAVALALGVYARLSSRPSGHD